jgi:hypothetical protein
MTREKCHVMSCHVMSFWSGGAFNRGTTIMFQTIHTNNDTTLMTPNSDATMAQHAKRQLRQVNHYPDK